MPPTQPGTPDDNGQPVAADQAAAETLPPAAAAQNEAAPETRTLPPRPPATEEPAESGPVMVPGYEVLGELGRGGMGVVYKARHLALNRLVALKMILAGGHAGTEERRRFVTEAEAVARLQHPHIVQIYEIGESEGRPFFSLEYCAGGSLADRLDGTPLPAGEAARLVEVLAHAMYAAHQAGVVHRDLKPANVLLQKQPTTDHTDNTDKNGPGTSSSVASVVSVVDLVPKITDFGLAKKLDDAAGQTASGAIMGTPSYMAPEQAGGKGQQVGPAADVYALGAILYELLTGRPPFKAATALDTILQVVSDEPVPPRQLQSKTPPDLETVCLKSLQKEPRKRYATAEELAEDLRRFRVGEPIQARPVGRAERAAKWVRRNPVLAGLSAAVALALLVGTAVSTGFGIDARRQAERAKENEADAVAKGEKLAAANESLTRTANDLQLSQNNLKQTADNLERSRDEMELTLARSLIRPLRLQEGGGVVPVNDPEWDAFWELATARGGRLGYRFVEEASRTPVTSRQLRDRASLALSAAAGLEPERRAKIENLLMARLDDPAIGDDQKNDLAVAAAGWDGLSSSAACRTARQLAQALRDSKNPYTQYALSGGLRAAAARMEAKDAAQAAAAVVRAMNVEEGSYNLLPLAEGLSVLAGRMDTKDAATVTAKAGTTLVHVMKKGANGPGVPYALVSLGQGLSALAAHMDARDAAALTAQAAPPFLQAMKDPQYLDALYRLAQGLSVLASR
ncbi:MAG TPA: serine/threonine-protein kinase, partial [Gemmataceae bacterium]|nr:serine/threonine-protein kinase [Gemmataceae bacterium]